MISVSNLTMQFGARVLFANASFQLNPGERYGLVGANGSGKTTLLNILSGDQPEFDGTVAIPKNARLGVLRQDQFLYEDQEILAVALMGHPELWDVLVEKEKLLANAHVDFDVDRFSELEDAFQRMDGYTAETRAATILEGLGIPTEVHRQPLSTLSGGFKLRVLLAQVLAGAPDVLLLDEPTNHLDILSIRWLEKFLQNFQGPAVIISHDHRFLDNVATKILDVDYATVTLYHGNYTHFGEQKVSERERREKEIEGRQKEIAHHQKFVDRFKAKNSKARQAQSKIRMIERIAEDLEELPGSSRRYPKFRFKQGTASGKDVLKIKGIRKAFGDNEVLHGVNLQVQRGDRLVIMGPNGIGKSTLLKIAMADLDADGGTIEWGHGTRPGYFAQDHHEKLDGIDVTAERWLWDFCPGRDRGYVRGELGLMLFSGDAAEKSLTTLSGGEAARLMFARLQVEQPNVLVLDEPTNHLDLESIEALVNGLRNYDGTLILVSHDRWFVNQLATRVVEITHAGIRDYHGTYEEYVHDCGDDHLDADNVVLKTKRAEKKARPETADGRATDRRTDGIRSKRNGAHANAGTGGNGAKGRGVGVDGRSDPADARRREERLAELTVEIEALESAIADIDATFAAPGYFDNTPGDRIRELQSERGRLENRLERLMEEWERLERESEAVV